MNDLVRRQFCRLLAVLAVLAGPDLGRADERVILVATVTED
ncbi:MAG TPA: hypothetical protein VG734_20120 [Lacunisphaera sp.]|nr:hypothetical protein [Lacunisphaera sp.]